MVFRSRVVAILVSKRVENHKKQTNKKERLTGIQQKGEGSQGQPRTAKVWLLEIRREPNS